MEYKLNKIDMDIRRKVNESADETKIHPKKKIEINKDKEKKDSHQQAQEYRKESKDDKQDKNKKIIISAEKTLDVDIEGFINKDKDSKLKKGMFLDIKK